MAKENKKEPLICHRSLTSAVIQEEVPVQAPADKAPDIFKPAAGEQPLMRIELKTVTGYGLCQLERCPLYEAKTGQCLDRLEKLATIEGAKKLDAIAADVAGMLQVQSAGEA